MFNKRIKYQFVATFLLIAIFVFGGITPAAAQQLQNLPIIKAIVIRGNQNIDTAIIQQAITKTKVNDAFIEQNVIDDIEAVYSLGYFLDVWASFELAVEGGIKVIFEVVENPTITDIIFIGAKNAPVSNFTKEMQLKKGDILNVNLLFEDLERFPEWVLDNHGISLRPVNLNVTEEGVIEIEVAESVIQDVIIEGNEKTKDHVILRELSFAPGDILDINQINNSLRNVLMLGFFDEVSFSVDDGDDPDSLILTIHLVERTTGSADFGVGFNSEDRFSVYVDVSDENFFGNGQRANIYLNIAGKKWEYELGFFEPYILKGGTSLGANISSRHEKIKEKIDDQEVEGNMHTLGGDITVGHPLGENTRGSLTLRAETDRYNGDIADYDDYKDSYAKLVLSTGVLTNTTDNPFVPTEGFKNRVYLETGMRLLGGGAGYSKISFEHSRYYKIFRDDIIFAVRGKGGRVLTGDLRDKEKFRIAGSENLRGYEGDREGLTGDKMLLVNSELRFPIYDSISGVAFTDWGKAWETEDRMDITDLLNSYGLGIRIDTPFGLLRFDYGWGLNEEEKREGKFYFSIGHTF